MVLFSRPGRTPIPQEIATSILQEVVDTWNPLTGSSSPHPLAPLQCVNKDWQRTVVGTPSLWSNVRLSSPNASQLAFLSRQLTLSKSLGLHIILQNTSMTVLSAMHVRQALARLDVHKYRWKSACFVLWSSSEISGVGNIFASPAPALTELMLACEHNASTLWTSRAVQWVGSCTALRNIDLELSINGETPLTQLITDALPGRLSTITVLASYFNLDNLFLDMLRQCTNLRVLDVLSLSVDLSQLPASTTVAQLPSLVRLYVTGEEPLRGLLLSFVLVTVEAIATFGDHRIDMLTVCAGVLSHPCAVRALNLVVSDGLQDSFESLLACLKGPLQQLDELQIFLDSLQPLPSFTRSETILLPNLFDLTLKSCRSDGALHSFILPRINAPLLQKLVTGAFSPCVSLVEDFLTRSGCALRTLQVPLFSRETSRLGPLLVLAPHLSHLHLYTTNGDQLLEMLCRYNGGRTKSLQVLPLLSILRISCASKDQALVKKVQKLRPSLMTDFYTERMTSPAL